MVGVRENKAKLVGAVSSWSSETLFESGDQLFSQMLQEIGTARRSITLETFIFDQDELGADVIEALKQASRKGVRVRLLLDGVGCSQWNLGELEEISKHGLKVRVYHPLPWQNRNFAWKSAFQLRRILLGFWKLNRRNHRKCCVIDGRVAFVGGMNVSSRQLRSHSGESALRDTSVRIEGAGVSVLSHAFESAWRHTRNLKHEWRRKSKMRSNPLVRLNRTNAERRASYRDLLHHVITAKDRIWMANPYFVPDLSLISALRYAAWNGVDVRLMFPRDNNIWGFKWAAKAFYLPLLSAGIKIFEYRPSLLHAKVALLDNWAIVGSSNLNQRTLLHDLEVDVILSNPSSVRSLEKSYENDLLDSDLLDYESWKRRSWIQYLMQRMALLFRRWI